MYNLLIVNADKVANIFVELTATASPAVQDWFHKTLFRHWQAVWTREGFRITSNEPTKISKSIPGMDDPKSRVVYGRTLRAMQNPPSLVPSVINGTGSHSISFSTLSETQMKALANGAIPVHLPAIKTVALIHTRDFLEHYHAQNPTKDLSKLTPNDLPAMVAAWDRELRRVKELVETEQSIATLYKAKNGYSLCVIGSIKATKYVGERLRNCLRSSSSYFTSGSLLCVKDAKDKIVAALDTRLYQRVLITQEGDEVTPVPVMALALQQFYGAENEAPPVDAVECFNEWVRVQNIRSAEDVNELALTTSAAWDDAADEDEDEDADDDADQVDTGAEDPQPARRVRRVDDEGQDF
jgi:hypothetical protein